MRSYFIDELLPQDVARIEEALTLKGYAGGLSGIYFLPIPQELYNAEQVEHAAECGPYCLAIETGTDWLKLELLVRGRGKLRCSCIAYCEPEARNAMIDRLDKLIRELDIPV